MPAFRYASVPVPMEEENAKRAIEALTLVKKQEALTANDPRVEELAQAFSGALAGCETSLDEKEGPLCYLHFYLRAESKLEPSALMLETEQDGWVDNDPLIRIVQACQTELDGGPASWVYDDDIYGEKSNGAVFVAPDEDAIEMTLGQWLAEQARYAAERRAGRTIRPESGEHFVLLEPAQAQLVREALAIVDQEGTDWVRARYEAEDLTFETAFPHARRGNAHSDAVKQLSLAVLKDLAETVEDPSDAIALSAAPPLSFVTTELGHQGLYILAAEQDDPECVGRAIKASMTVNSTVRTFFNLWVPAPEAAPAAADSTATAAPGPM